MKVLRLFSVLLILSVLIFAACSSQDMTKVTIYFAKDKQASLEQINIPLIDRILNLFSSNAYAQIHSSGDTENYELIVYADDFDGAFAFAPGTASSISIEVPSGKSRVFLLYSISPSAQINYTGQSVIDLTGGNASVSINMYPCLYNIQVAPFSTQMQITWNHDITLDGKSLTLTIHRACVGTDTLNCNGNLTIINPSYAIESDTYTDFSIASLPGNQYYYFLTVNTGTFGNGGIQVPINLADLQYYYSLYFIGNVWNLYYYPFI